MSIKPFQIAFTLIASVSFVFGVQGSRQAARFIGAANQWMLDPVDVSRQADTVETSVRTRRDAYWDKYFGQASPLSMPSASAVGHFHEGVVLPNSPEFPKLANGVWVIGKFENAHTYLSRSQRSIYTEVNVRVQRVFAQTGEAHAMAGDLLDVGDVGGTIKAPWGGTYSYQVEPLHDYFQPGHKYLILLEYLPEGQFFVVAKRWELTGGRVEPEGPEINRTRNGKSEIAGLDEDSLNRFLKSKFASSER